MEGRYFKDFTIAIVFIMILVYGYWCYRQWDQSKRILGKSATSELSTELQEQIRQIDQSIKDRETFHFTAQKDPLEQNLIVKTKIDLEMQWKQQVESMVRLAATYITENSRGASIAYQGKTKYYPLNAKFQDYKIVEVGAGYVILQQDTFRKRLDVQKIPPKPVELDSKKEMRELNW